MQCPACHVENRKGRGFCAECGAPMAVVCSRCDFSNEVNEKFCGGCGAELIAQAPRASPAARAPQSYTPAHLAERVLNSRALSVAWRRLAVIG